MCLCLFMDPKKFIKECQLHGNGHFNSSNNYAILQHFNIFTMS